MIQDQTLREDVPLIFCLVRTGDTLWGADIHTTELWDAVIHLKRWDHVENTSIFLKGSNPPFTSIKRLLIRKCNCHNWHKKQGWICHKLCYRGSTLQIAVSFMYAKNECQDDTPWMNINTLVCIATVFFNAGKTSVMCFSWQTHKIAFTALNTRRIAALSLLEHFKSSMRNARSLDVLLPILHVKTCRGS